MAHYQRSGYLVSDSLTYTPVAGRLKIEGEIACPGNIIISVFKLLKMGPGADPQIQTERYAYNASFRGHGSFLRHDNAHPFDGHADDHHKHSLDWRSSAEKERPDSPSWVGEANWPTLSQFIEYVGEWYFAHRDELPDPDGVPTLGLRNSKKG